MPQPNETERALMALLQKERERNGVVQAAEPPLPELDPSMFLSPAAQREVAAVQSLPTSSMLLSSLASRVPEVIHSTRETEIDFSVSSDWNITENDLEPSPRYAAEEVAPDLANLFMDRALRETGGTAADRRRAERLGTDLDFSFFSFSSSDFEVDEVPRRYETPPRATGGVEVARRGPVGFQQVSRAEAVARSEARSAAQQRPASIQAPQTSQEPARSRYERLLGPSIID